MKCKGKGQAYERWCCRQLSLWVSKGTDNDLYWRSSMSGGAARLATQRGKRGEQIGDITCIDKRGHGLTDNFVIECKHKRRSALMVDNLLFDSSKAPIIGIFRQTRDDAMKRSKQPLVLVRQTGCPDLAITTWSGVQTLKAQKALIAIFPRQHMYVMLFRHLMVLTCAL